MRYNWLDEYLLAKPGTEKDLQENWNWIRYKFGGKMYAAICLDNDSCPYYINLKLEPAEGAMLRVMYSDIQPGYYSNKMHWNSVLTVSFRMIFSAECRTSPIIWSSIHYRKQSKK